VGHRGRRRRHPGHRVALARLHRGFMRLGAAAFVVSTGPNLGWAVTYAEHGYRSLAAAATLSALGAARIALALGRTRLEPPGGDAHVQLADRRAGPLATAATR
jgi:hypothetical protein